MNDILKKLPACHSDVAKGSIIYAHLLAACAEGEKEGHEKASKELREEMIQRIDTLKLLGRTKRYDEGFREGQEKMRERVARSLETCLRCHGTGHWRTTIGFIMDVECGACTVYRIAAREIRALPIEEPR